MHFQKSIYIFFQAIPVPPLHPYSLEKFLQLLKPNLSITYLAKLPRFFQAIAVVFLLLPGHFIFAIRLYNVAFNFSIYTLYPTQDCKTCKFLIKRELTIRCLINIGERTQFYYPPNILHSFDISVFFFFLLFLLCPK